MTARDDYPIGLVDRTVLYTIDPGMWKDMCDEIDQLRASLDALGMPEIQAVRVFLANQIRQGSPRLDLPPSVIEWVLS